MTKIAKRITLITTSLLILAVMNGCGNDATQEAPGKILLESAHFLDIFEITKGSVYGDVTHIMVVHKYKDLPTTSYILIYGENPHGEPGPFPTCEGHPGGVLNSSLGEILTRRIPAFSSEWWDIVQKLGVEIPKSS